MPRSDILVRARGLTKRFGDFTAVDGIDFDLYRGEAFGFPDRGLGGHGDDPDLLWRAAYLAVLGLVGLHVSGRRLARLLLV